MSKTVGRTVLSIHFEDFSGVQFERLVFAYQLRTADWQSLEWLGQSGRDGGRDIWGAQRSQDGKLVHFCTQCVNRRRITLAKISGDLKKISKWSPRPSVFRVVCGGPISAKLRDKVRVLAKNAGIPECEVWSGAEFEERLRKSCEPVLKRFCEGVEFPDASDELGAFVSIITEPSTDDESTLKVYACLFDRPAFKTPFANESNLGHFRKAISDTIQALNTGLWQNRDGREIARIPSRHDLRDPAKRVALAGIETAICNLRAIFDNLVRSKEIRVCCGSEDKCGIFQLSGYAVREMDDAREELLEAFRAVYPAFSAKLERRRD